MESQLEELFGRNIDIININDENTNELIKIEALNSRFVAMMLKEYNVFEIGMSVDKALKKLNDIGKIVYI